VSRSTSSPENSTLELDIRLVVENLGTLDPTSNHTTSSPRSKSMLFITSTLLSFVVMFCPTSDLTQLAGQLTTILGMDIGRGEDEVHQGLGWLLEYTTLLFISDARCKDANSF